MKVDRFTKAVLTGIFLCLVLLTLKEYDIISDAEAATDVTDVNIVSIDGNSLPNGNWKGRMYSFIPVKVQARVGGNENWYTPSMRVAGKNWKLQVTDEWTTKALRD